MYSTMDRSLRGSQIAGCIWNNNDTASYAIKLR